MVGLFLNNYTNNRIAGVIFQVIAFIYTAASFYIPLFSDSTPNGIEEPTIYFTDRQQTINLVIEKLYTIIFEKSDDKIIAILCEDSAGCGKTTLLLKIAQIPESVKLILNNSGKTA